MRRDQNEMQHSFHPNNYSKTKINQAHNNFNNVLTVEKKHTMR